MMNSMLRQAAAAAASFLFASAPGFAADHGDTPHLIAIPRHDARISDLHVFTSGANLVLALSTFPNLAGASYQFPSDLTLRFHIDNHTRVAFDNAIDNAQFGGRIVRPRNMGADIVVEFTFDDAGRAILSTTGLTDRQERDIRAFAGVRDDPFIRGPQIGRNVASVVVEFPLDDALGCGGKKKACDDVILVWATSNVPDIAGPQAELGGRALRSQCPTAACNAVDGPDLNVRNEMSPTKHARLLGMRPDVVIFDSSRAAGFPNGRLLTDDVVSIIASFGQNILGNDYPCPTANDASFLSSFPYLAPPHVGPPPVISGPACSS